MRIVILGASGGCGRHLVTQGLAAGHDVIAVGRAGSKLDFVDEARVRRGAVDDEDFLAETFAGAQVVCSALGLRLPGLAPWAKADDHSLLRRAGPAIARAAQRAGVQRILAITAGGVGDSYATMPAFFRFFIKVTALRTVYPELDIFEQALWAAEGVEVCCVRPTGLTDEEPATGEAVVATQLSGYAQISRADVAAFMLQHLEGPLPGRAPVITVTGAG